MFANQLNSTFSVHNYALRRKVGASRLLSHKSEVLSSHRHKKHREKRQSPVASVHCKSTALCYISPLKLSPQTQFLSPYCKLWRLVFFHSALCLLYFAHKSKQKKLSP